MRRLGFVFVITLILFYCTSAFAELSVGDLEKIQQLLDKSEERIDKRFTDLEKSITAEIRSFEKQFSIKIKGLDERIDYLGALIVALIIAIIGFVSVPMAFITFQYFKIRSQQEDEIKALREKIESLEAQILVENQS